MVQHQELKSLINELQNEKIDINKEMIKAQENKLPDLVALYRGQYFATGQIIEKLNRLEKSQDLLPENDPFNFPRQLQQEGGWTINTDFLKSIANQIQSSYRNHDLADIPPSLEQIEMILLALEESSIKEQ